MLHAISVHVSSDLLVAVSFGLRVDNGYWDDTGAVTPADLKLHIVTYTYFSCIFVRTAVQFSVNHWTYVLTYILEVVACVISLWRRAHPVPTLCKKYVSSGEKSMQCSEIPHCIPHPYLYIYKLYVIHGPGIYMSLILRITFLHMHAHWNSACTCTSCINKVYM